MRSEKRGEEENEFQSKLGIDGNGKVNLSFPCNSPLNPLYRNEFDTLDLTLLTNKNSGI